MIRPDVSIVIVNWNTRDYLQDCLASVYEQTRNITFEVIVVDNASADSSVEMVKAEFPRVVLVENIDNRGFAAANNQGLTVTTGRYVLLLNPDTIVLDGAVQKTVQYADDHPDVGVVGCQVWENESTVQRTCFRFPTIWNLVAQKAGFFRFLEWYQIGDGQFMAAWPRDSEREVDVVSGMFMLVRKEAVQAVGLMDEAYFVYAEETDWCDRFWRAGWRCVFTPTARILHRDGGSKSTEQVSTKMYVQKEKSLLLFYKKRRGWPSWIAAKVMYSISACMKCMIFKLWFLIRKDDLRSQRLLQSWAALKFHLFGIEPV